MSLLDVGADARRPACNFNFTSSQGGGRAFVVGGFGRGSSEVSGGRRAPFTPVHDVVGSLEHS
jgi:hypothetical protein